MAKLNERQKAFVREYIIDFNGTQAAIKAGYAASGAEVTASKLIRNPKVGPAIAKAIEDRAKRTEIDADYVLKRLVEIDQMDVADISDENGNVLPVSKWPKVWRQSLSGIDVSEFFEGNGSERQLKGLIKKIKWPDTTRTLELLGKHVNIQAFKDKVDVSVSTTLADALRESERNSAKE